MTPGAPPWVYKGQERQLQGELGGSFREINKLKQENDRLKQIIKNMLEKKPLTKEDKDFLKSIGL